MSDLLDNLKAEFQDEDYRYAYAQSFLNTKLAAQIKTLREQRSMTQAQAAAKMGIKQPGYRRFEDVNHRVWKTDSLWDIARTYGVRLDISFKRFGTLPEEKKHLDKESLRVPKFEDDPAFKKSPVKELGPAEASSEGAATGALKALAGRGDDLSWLGNSFDVANQISSFGFSGVSSRNWTLRDLGEAQASSGGAIENKESLPLPVKPAPDRFKGFYVVPPRCGVPPQERPPEIDALPQTGVAKVVKRPKRTRRREDHRWTIKKAANQ